MRRRVPRPGDALPALVELLRRYFGIEETDTPARIGERIEQALRDLALALQGERDHAIRLLGESTTMVQGPRVPLLLTRRTAWLGEAARCCGRPQEAWRLADEALRLARAHKESGDEAWTLRLLGDLASDREPPDLPAVEGHYRDALALAEALGMRPLIAHCHRGLGVLYRRAGDSDRARRELRVARDLYRDMGMAVWQERADSELGEGG